MRMCQNHIDTMHWVSWMQLKLLISVEFGSIQFTISIQLGLVFIFTPNKMCNSLLVSRLFHWHFSLTVNVSMIRLSHEKFFVFRFWFFVTLKRCLYHGSVPSRGLQNSLSNYLNTQRFRDFNIICVHHSVVILLLLIHFDMKHFIKFFSFYFSFDPFIDWFSMQ